MDGSRKKWEAPAPKLSVASLKPSQPRAQDGYDQYLTMLQERNRLLKKLRQKDSRQVEMEKRENGFSLYLNGANLSQRQLILTRRRKMEADVSTPISSSTSDPITRTRETNTADFCVTGTDAGDDMLRAKSAPSKRKSWSHKRVELKTADGKPIRIEAPGILSGNYEDDFESSMTQDQIASMMDHGSGESVPNDASVEVDSEASLDKSDGIAVGFNEISALRESLASDSIIKKSLDELHSDDGDLNHSEHDPKPANLQSLSGPASDESCSEDLEEDEPNDSPPPPPPFFLNQHGIVLEFEGPACHTSKELESNSSTSTVMLPSSKVRPEGHSSDTNQESAYIDTEEDRNSRASKAGAVSVLQKSNQKPTRLLSAARKKTDSSRKNLLSVEAMQDVLEAVRAENEMVCDVVVGSREDKESISTAALRTGLADSSIAPSTDPVAPRTDTGAPRTGRESIEGLAHAEQRGDLVASTNRLTSEDGESCIEKSVDIDSNAPRNGDNASSSPLVSPAVDSCDQQEDASTLQLSSEAGGSQASKLPHKPSLVIKPVLLNYSIPKPSSRHHFKQTTTTLKSELGHTPNLELEESGGVAMEGGGMASPSLTEHTLKIITQKVRDMNSKQQHKLLDLLGKLDRQLLASPASVSTSAIPSPSVPSPVPVSPTPTPASPMQVTSASDTESTSTLKGCIPTDNSTSLDSYAKEDKGASSSSSSLICSVEQRDPGGAATSRDTSSRGALKLVTASSADEEGRIPRMDDGLSDSLDKGSNEALDSKKKLRSHSSCNTVLYQIKPLSNSEMEEPIRVGSGRMSGLRRELISGGGELTTNRGNDQAEVPGPRSSVESHPTSGRRTGLRGELMSREGSAAVTGSRAVSRLGSGRTTGLRGELAQDQDGGVGDDSDERPEASSTVSLSTETLNDYIPRLGTAVLAKGNRPIFLGNSGSDTCLLPEISMNMSCRDEDVFLRKDQNVMLSGKLLSRSEECLTPVVSDRFPELSSAHHRPDSQVPSPGPTQLSMDDCLASISKFDHSHLGQIRSDMQDDILEDFLSEYRQKKKASMSATPQPQSPTSYDQNAESWHLKGEEPPSSQRCEDLEGGFSIPELPIGRELVINILSTWGDRFYVGLTGIEVFTASGEQAKIKYISADPSDINVLPEYCNDPRVVGNLLDGTNQTKDDLHMWLTPFTPGKDHLIRMQFSIPYALALVRIWNYNKSRIHSSRGARQVEMSLDGLMIFSGEVVRATPTSDVSENCEIILFTVDETVLERVSHHDPVFQRDHTHTQLHDRAHSHEVHRPTTTHAESEESDLRPFTSSSATTLDSILADMTKCESRRSLSKSDSSIGTVVEVLLCENWGDSAHIGMTGITLLGECDRQPIALRPDQLTLSVSGSGGGDDGFSGGRRCMMEVARLVDGVDVTTDAAHMWACPVPRPSSHLSLTFVLDTPTLLAGLRVWNYNQSMEESYKGVKLIQVYIDGSPLLVDGGDEGEGSEVRVFLLRRAPGHVQFNFPQDILFHHQEARNRGIPAYYPRGFIFQFQLISTWGDPYYIGLNGLEFYDQMGQKIPLTTDNIGAFPESVNVLPDICGDLRTPDKLVDGVFDTLDGQHTWLAPVLPGLTNTVYVVFDEPQALSKVLLWNYGKTQRRGVKELALLVDDLLVFTGTMPATPTHARGILPSLTMPLEPFLISFTDTPLPHHTQEDLTKEGDVQFVNNHQVMSGATALRKHSTEPNQDLRPLTSLTQSSLPNTKWWHK